MGARSVVAVALAVACTGVPALAETRADPVFLVIIDGCAPRYLWRLDMPNLRGLARAGAWTDRATTVYPSLTLPAVTSIVSGVPIVRHGVDWDEWRPELGPLRTSSVFTEARRAGLRCAGFVGPKKLEHLAPEGVFDAFRSFGRSDSVIVNAAIEHLRHPETRASLYFVHLPDVEEAGLHYGWGSLQYMNALLEADRQLGQLLTAVDRLALSRRSAIIVTSDHGGEANRHDLNVESVIRIPWIAAGAGVRQDYCISTDVRAVDTAPTVLTLLGVSPPDSWEGRVPDRVLALEPGAPPERSERHVTT